MHNLIDYLEELINNNRKCLVLNLKQNRVTTCVHAHIKQNNPEKIFQQISKNIGLHDTFDMRDIIL